MRSPPSPRTPKSTGSPSCSPSVIVPKLFAAPPAYAEFLFSRIAAILFESQSTGGWEILARQQFRQTLAEVGVLPQPANVEERFGLGARQIPHAGSKPSGEDHR